MPFQSLVGSHIQGPR